MRSTPLGIIWREVHCSQDLLQHLSKVLRHHGLQVWEAEVSNAIVDKEKDLLPICQAQLSHIGGSTCKQDIEGDTVYIDENVKLATMGASSALQH